MITRELLESLGWKYYKPNYTIDPRGVKEIYQKRLFPEGIREDEKFFIDAYHWDLNMEFGGGDVYLESWEFRAQFRKDDSHVFNLQTVGWQPEEDQKDAEFLNSVETFFKKIYYLIDFE